MTTTTATRVRMIVVGAVLPLAVTVAGVGAVLMSLPLLPSPIAIHWGPSGMPDGFGAPWLAVILPLVIVLAYGAFAIVVVGMTRERGIVTANQKLILSIGPFLAVVVTGVIAGSTLLQRGLSDAANAPSIFPLLLASFGGGIALGCVSWFLLPPVSPASPQPDATDLPRLNLDDAARAVWVQRVAPSRALGTSLTVVLTVAIVAGGTALWTTAPLAAFVVYLLGTALLMVLVIGTLYWRVTIDSRGFRAISVVGFPRFTIPLEQIESADEIVVQPAGDFGGWGLRWGGRRRVGIIMRSGEALEVRRKDGRQLVVTVPRARTAAALLNSLLQRA